MQHIYLCFQPDCKADSRLIRSSKAITSQNGEHFGHINEELIDLQSQLEKYDFSSDQLRTNTLLIGVDEFCHQFLKSCELLLDQYASIQKRSITQQIEYSPEYSKSQLLLKAVLQTDLKVLEENQNSFQILRRIDLILGQEKQHHTKFELKVTYQNDIISQRLQDIFNFDYAMCESPEIEYKIEVHKQQFIEAYDQVRNTVRQLLLENKQDEDEYRDFQDDTKLKQEYLNVKYNAQIKIIQDLKDQLSTQQKGYDQMRQDYSKIENQLKMTHTKQLTFDRSIFKWSDSNRNTNIQIFGNSIKNTHEDFNCVLLDPKMSFNQVMKVYINITNASYVMLHICDLKMIEANSRNFKSMYLNQGQMTQNSVGNTWINGAQRSGGFSFAKGDTLELLWDGPQGKFTTTKMSTGQIHQFIVDFDQEAEIYFGVSLYYEDQEIQIM